MKWQRAKNCENTEKWAEMEAVYDPRYAKAIYTNFMCCKVY